MKKISYFVYFLLVTWLASIINIAAAQSQLSFPATSPFLPSQWHIGFGFAVEYLNMEAKLKLQPSRGLEDFVTAQSVSANQSQTGKHFQIAPCVEFGKFFEMYYYLGLVASWRYSGLKSSSSSVINGVQHFKHEFKLNYYADILIKAGYKVSPQVMVYGLIGPSMTNWTHSSNQFENSQTVVDKFKINKSSVGMVFGMGIQYYTQKDWVLSLNYTHHLHSPVSRSHSMAYSTQDAALVNHFYSGELRKKIDLSYGTVAIRFTKFFSL